LMMPAFLTLAATQINLMVDNKLASYLGNGGVSSLQYAMRLFQLPLGVLAVSVATALLPRFSEAWARRDEGAYYRYLNEGVVSSALVLLPAMVGLFVIGPDLVRFLFQHGSFTASDSMRTTQVLFHYLIGLAPYGWVYVLTRGAYAQGNPRLAVFASIVGAGVNVGLDLILVRSMGAPGLALATAIAGLCNASLLGIVLLRHRRFTARSTWLLAWIAVGCAGLFVVASLSRAGVRDAPLWLAVLVPTLAGTLFYAVYVRLTPLWRSVASLRENE
jgi:putative peptidoglycan lipid II flippase